MDVSKWIDNDITSVECLDDLHNLEIDLKNAFRNFRLSKIIIEHYLNRRNNQFYYNQCHISKNKNMEIIKFVLYMFNETKSVEEILSDENVMKSIFTYYLFYFKIFINANKEEEKVVIKSEETLPEIKNSVEKNQLAEPIEYKKTDEVEITQNTLVSPNPPIPAYSPPVTRSCKNSLKKKSETKKETTESNKKSKSKNSAQTNSLFVTKTDTSNLKWDCPHCSYKNEKSQLNCETCYHAKTTNLEGRFCWNKNCKKKVDGEFCNECHLEWLDISNYGKPVRQMKKKVVINIIVCKCGKFNDEKATKCKSCKDKF